MRFEVRTGGRAWPFLVVNLLAKNKYGYVITFPWKYSEWGRSAVS